MPISIYDLADDRKTVSLEFGPSTLTVTYKPNALTPARELAILRSARAESDDEAGDDDELARAQFNIERQLGAFAELVEAWDFSGPLAINADGDRLDIPRDLTETDDVMRFVESHKGKLLVGVNEIAPIRVDVLKVIGSNFLMQVTAKINEDMRPDPKRRRR